MECLKSQSIINRLKLYVLPRCGKSFPVENCIWMFRRERKRSLTNKNRNEPRNNNTGDVSKYWWMEIDWQLRQSDRKCDCCSMHSRERRWRPLPLNPSAAAPPSCRATSGSIASQTEKAAAWGCCWTYQFYSPQFRISANTGGKNTFQLNWQIFFSPLQLTNKVF